MEYPSVCEVSACADRVVCRCLNITEGDVVGALVSLEIRTIKELCDRTDAGTGCTACHVELRRLFERHAYAPSSSSSPICSVK
jgi:NAD(P)H-nitrite reductase large subunit